LVRANDWYPGLSCSGPMFPIYVTVASGLSHCMRPFGLMVTKGRARVV
jgi:hypothetical protein